MTESRKKVIDHSPIIWDHHVVLIVNPAEMFNWMTFISPLKFHSWLVVGITIVVCSVALALSGHLVEGEIRKTSIGTFYPFFYQAMENFGCTKQCFSAPPAFCSSGGLASHQVESLICISFIHNQIFQEF